MDIQQLRQSLKIKWLIYYEQNRSWLVKMRVWDTYDGLRRPSSGYILATLSVLEPQFEQIVSFIVDLNNNPDRIIAALGLNFNPDEELGLPQSEQSLAINQIEDEAQNQPTPQVNGHSPVKPSLIGPPRGHKPLLFKITTQVEHQHQPASSIAVATKLPLKTLVSQKPLSRNIREHQAGRSLIIATEVPSKIKTLPNLAIATEIPRQTKTLPFLTVVTDVSSNGKSVKLPIQDIPQTNARSIASWVDEFCQGRGGNREEAVFTPTVNKNFDYGYSWETKGTATISPWVAPTCTFKPIPPALLRM